ncbi:MAG: cysteine desulfurase [Phycisphaerales bacterium]|nr:cysteine desulfurase [Phycisphaerales bacterium]
MPDPAPTLPIDLDNNATTRPLDEVRLAVDRSLAELWHNPSSVHRAGQAARQKLELARKHLADLIGAKPKHLTLCGSGTEAIDLAIRGTLLAQGRLGAKHRKPPGALITTKVEHAAVRDLAAALDREEGVRTLWLDLDPLGRARPDHLRHLLDTEPDIALVSVQWANNETGIIHPVAEIAEFCRSRGVPFHTDATQWVGKMPTSVDDFSPTLLTFSPHKFHGLKGLGVLYAAPNTRLAPLIHGTQETGRRGGTENVPGILAGGIAAQSAIQWLNDPAHRANGAALRDRFERGVLARIPDAVVNPTAASADAPSRLWNTTNIAFPRLEAEALLLLLSERGLLASAGAACSSGSLEPSPVLLAMNIPPELAHGSLRFSISRFTTQAEIDAAIDIVTTCVQRLRQSSSSTATQ